MLASRDQSTSGQKYVQGAFDELDAPLRETTFVVVDLETTGGAPDGAGITEIGAVKVRGGEILGEFETLVNPGVGIPPFIAVLTGITDTMVVEAPRIESVLPSFLEFAHGAVLVAHNAPYDVGFLKAACAGQGYPWPRFQVVDTVTVARRALTRDEVPNCKLATLARFFHASHEPCHRALADARATVDVLHGLLARVGNQRVQTLPELIEFCRAVTPAQRRKRHLADGVPAVPGVYVFRDARERPLYIGVSNNLATRVRSYFTAAESRSRISEMLNAAERVDSIECAHSLEAEVRELRLIAAHKPPYNRRSKFPERVSWLKLTQEPYPRLSLVGQLRDDGAVYLGPFSSRKHAELAMAAAHEALPLRQCTPRLSLRTTSPACVLAEMGRCPAPCEHRISVADYAAHTDAFTAAATGDPAVLLDRLLERIGTLANAQRYEDAASLRTRLVAFLRAAVRMQRLSSLTSIGELVAARPSEAKGWEIAVVRRGRLVAAGASPPRAHPRATLDVLLATAETVTAGPGPTPCASVEETERILAWLERSDTRLVQADRGWAYRVSGAARWRDLLRRAETAASAVDPFAERGLPRPGSRPTRFTA
ncbi:MAG: DEDD exonuclease domain-containing protein [Micromonosporaceae bacterium]